MEGRLPEPPPTEAPAQAAPARAAPPASQPDSLEAIERDSAALVARSKRQLPQINEQEALALVERRKALSGVQNAAPAEEPPVSVADSDLPPITLPEGVSADDPVVRGVREIGVYAEVPPPAVERLVAHVHGLLQTELPDEEEYWRQSDAMVAAAQQKYGPRFNAFLNAMKRGRRFVEQHQPALAEVLEDWMVQKDPMVAEILAAVGSKGRSLYVRKYGTKPVVRL
jgi:hypothetical protein